MKVTLDTPCDNCPFRSDVDAYITPERGREIWASLQKGAEFPCHKTTVDSGDDEGNRHSGPDSKFCAGALVMMEHRGGAEQNQLVRIGMRLGLIDLEKLNRGAPVFHSPEEWFAHLGEEETELEYCDVAGVDCTNAPGFAGGGGAIDNEDPPECDPKNACQWCGSVMCGACEGPDSTCETCKEDEE